MATIHLTVEQENVTVIDRDLPIPDEGQYTAEQIIKAALKAGSGDNPLASIMPPCMLVRRATVDDKVLWDQDDDSVSDGCDTGFCHTTMVDGSRIHLVIS